MKVRFHRAGLGSPQKGLSGKSCRSGEPKGKIENETWRPRHRRETGPAVTRSTFHKRPNVSFLSCPHVVRRSSSDVIPRPFTTSKPLLGGQGLAGGCGVGPQGRHGRPPPPGDRTCQPGSGPGWKTASQAAAAGGDRQGNLGSDSREEAARRRRALGAPDALRAGCAAALIMSGTTDIFGREKAWHFFIPMTLLTPSTAPRFPCLSLHTYTSTLAYETVKHLILKQDTSVSQRMLDTLHCIGHCHSV